MTDLTSLTRNPLRAAMAGALALALPVTALVAPAIPAAAADSDQLDRAVAALRAIDTMKADFTQTDRAGHTLRGELTLKRPGKLRFEYDKGANMLVVSDGKRLTFIDYEVNQVQPYPIKNSPLGALLDPGRDVKKYGRLIPSGNPDVLSIEVRDPKKPEFGTFTAIMVKDAAAPGGLELVSWVQLDAQNQRTTVRLSNQRYGIAVPDSAFKFRDPRRSSRRPG
ncbi:LolA family protein [Croceibacterium aestuarii]|uniref:LolA family protein n=1 Tax=Croceibacterium aestuarii TaxID=3064139 RepID=UPI00272E925D|nr:outer membrane lipoprotein carrier protein LolA [Croceibacterium sp. D39]